MGYQHVQSRLFSVKIQKFPAKGLKFFAAQNVISRSTTGIITNTTLNHWHTNIIRLALHYLIL